ncbi:MAG TPA: isoprenylcysteine carboxylmethyltransferase family protein [Verrucomicrobiae bacterium]|nr:isoprenylcysteine carboxylmethyltransferase family protein [Verrucomicrobiae bacterium]
MLKAASILAYIGMAGALLALVAMKLLFSPNPFVIGAQLAAIILMFWARVTFGRRSFHAAANPTQGGLVTTGPYRYIRHPIYTAACLLGWAGVFGQFSSISFACGILLLLCAVVRMFCEEKLVIIKYPEYADYAARTWRMIPYVF